MRRRAQELGLVPEGANSRSTVSNYIHGETVPDDDWLRLFAVSFLLTDEEKIGLALAHIFGEPHSPVPIAQVDLARTSRNPRLMPGVGKCNR
jgi:hypothetical protein